MTTAVVVGGEPAPVQDRWLVTPARCRPPGAMARAPVPAGSWSRVRRRRTGGVGQVDVHQVPAVGAAVDVGRAAVGGEGPVRRLAVPEEAGFAGAAEGQDAAVVAGPGPGGGLLDDEGQYLGGIAALLPAGDIGQGCMALLVGREEALPDDRQIGRRPDPPPRAGNRSARRERCRPRPPSPHRGRRRCRWWCRPRRRRPRSGRTRRGTPSGRDRGWSRSERPAAARRPVPAAARRPGSARQDRPGNTARTSSGSRPGRGADRRARRRASRARNWRRCAMPRPRWFPTGCRPSPAVRRGSGTGPAWRWRTRRRPASARRGR